MKVPAATHTPALTAEALLGALSPDPLTDAELAARLQVSREHVQNRLADLCVEHLAVEVRRGQATAYRTSTPQEELARALAEQPRGLVRLEASERLASLLQQALEFVARIGIGQLEQFEELYRMGDVKRGDGSQLLARDCELVGWHAAEVKRVLLTLSPTASYGIYNTNLAPPLFQAWQMHKALRHRMAWDRQPQGGIGVWHDEPIVEGPLQDFHVYSRPLTWTTETAGRDAGAAPQVRHQVMHHVIDLCWEKVEVLALACGAYARACAGDGGFLVDWAARGLLCTREGAVPDEASRIAAASLLEAMALELHAGRGPLSSESGQAAQACAAALQDAVEKALQRRERGSERAPQTLPAEQGATESSLRITSAGSAPPALDLEPLPDHVRLNFKSGAFRIIGPSRRDGTLVVLGDSHSIQTALAMARNHAAAPATTDAAAPVERSRA